MNFNCFLAPFCFVVVSNAQTITIVNPKSDSINLVDFYFKEKSSPTKIKESKTIYGESLLKYQIKEKYKELLVEVDAYPFDIKELYLDSIQEGKEYQYNLKLENNSLIDSIEEVIYIAKPTPIKKRKNTVIFNVSAYKTNEDLKIGDVLQRIPGLQVNSKTGEVKYNGKSIETIMLDGDDLLGNNYSFLHKTINANAVKEIEAISNYSENRLLKEVSQKDKVALNLKIKEGILSFSGDTSLEFGGDIEPNLIYLGALDLLGLTKKTKLITKLAGLNTGENLFSMDYFSMRPNLTRLQEKPFRSVRLLPQQSYSFIVEDFKLNRNRQNSLQYFDLHKLTNKFKLKLNLGYLKDEIFYDDYFERVYQVQQNSIKNSLTTKAKRVPETYNFKLGFDYDLNKNNRLKYSFTYYNEALDVQEEHLKNEIEKK